jgi:lactoylglutathione lyase
MSQQPDFSKNPDPATHGYVFNHVMMRVRDPEVSLDFYTRILGMTLLATLDIEQFSFTNYYLGYTSPAERAAAPKEQDGQLRQMFSRQSVLELTHNWGTEDDDDFEGYHNGNSDPKGYGHICINVPDLEAACERFEELGVNFTKKPDQGGMKGLAFITDPDGYAIEVIGPETVSSIS